MFTGGGEIMPKSLAERIDAIEKKLADSEVAKELEAEGQKLDALQKKDKLSPLGETALKLKLAGYKKAQEAKRYVGETRIGSHKWGLRPGHRTWDYQ